METETSIFKAASGGFLFFEDHGGKCPNLLDNNLCGVYETRPSACRAFPMTYESYCLLCTLDRSTAQSVVLVSS